MTKTMLCQAQDRLATHSKLFTASVLLMLSSFLLLVSWLSRPASANMMKTGVNTESASRESTELKHSGKQQEDGGELHLLAATYYSVEGNFTATLMLLNQGPKPIEVQPTLFSTTGERLDAPPVAIGSHLFRGIDLRELVTSANPSFQQGSVQVVYQGKDLEIGGVVQMVDAERSLIFDEELVEPAKMFKSSRLEGVWWLPSRKHEVRLAISNTTNSPLSVTASVSNTAPKQTSMPAEADGIALERKGAVTLNLTPHETRVLDVRQDLGGDKVRALPNAGGISIEHSGPKGALVARAFIEEPTTGYSTVMEFYDPHRAKISQLHGAGLRLGSVAGEQLTSVVVARNVGDTNTVVTGRVPYTTSDGSMSAASLPEIRLAPGEARAVNLTKVVRRSGIEKNVASAGLEFEYTGEPGSVVMSAVSTSGSGNQVFRVPLIDPKVPRSSTGGYPWMIEENSSTMVYIKNVTDRPQQYTLYVSAAGEDMHAFGLKSVEAGQTVALDVRALRDNQVPDEQGRAIPPEAMQGRVHWSVHGSENHVLIGRAEQVDVARGLSSTSACGLCCPNSFAYSFITPGEVLGNVGSTTQFLSNRVDSECGGGLLPPTSQVTGIGQAITPQLQPSTV